MNTTSTSLVTVLATTILFASPPTAYTQSHDVHSPQTTNRPKINAPTDPGNVGFLVVAPDRGFLGNEEIRDAFAGFSEHYRSDLAFIPWHGDPLRYVTPAIEGLERIGAERVVVLPLFFAPSHSLLSRLQEQLSSLRDSVAIATPFGLSFLAEELLIERLRNILHAANNQPALQSDGNTDTAMLVVGFGALNDSAVDAMEQELGQLLEKTTTYIPNAESVAIALRHHAGGTDEQEASFLRLRNEAERLTTNYQRVLFIPLHFGQRMDSMMDLTHSLGRSLGDLSMEMVNPALPHPLVTTWMAREANRWLKLTREEIGFVIMPHGADIDWNESIREPLREIVQNRRVEYAFSMADSYVLSRAVTRLEERGARGIVVLRVFSQASSFRDRIEFLIGLGAQPGPTMGMAPPSRIHSASIFTTVGGIENHPLFARGLLERARELSTDPSNETVLLLGHGAGADEDNQRWLDNLESIAAQMHEQGDGFADIRWANWREDWPQYRDAEEANIMAMVQEEEDLGRTVIVIPARTTLSGPEPDQLGEFNHVRIGTGFAPHPLFAQWVGEQLNEGVALLSDSTGWHPTDTTTTCLNRSTSPDCPIAVR